MRSCQAQLDGVVMVVMIQDTIPVRPPLARAGNFINFGSELRGERRGPRLVRTSKDQPGLRGWLGEIYHLSFLANIVIFAADVVFGQL